jgi:hypothetical protein
MIEWVKMARPERFELPTFWFVAKQSLLILRDLRAKRALHGLLVLPNVPKASAAASPDRDPFTW